MGPLAITALPRASTRAPSVAPAGLTPDLSGTEITLRWNRGPVRAAAVGPKINWFQADPEGATTE